MTIHKEGYVYVFISGIIFIVVIWLPNLVTLNNLIYWFLFGTSAFFFIAFIQFFRNPRISINKDDRYVLAPADGKVVVIEETIEKEYFKEKRKQISIFMSPLNVHVNRTPISGVVKYLKYHPGKYLVAWHPKSSTKNERTTISVQHANGTEILFRQIAGFMARRIKTYIKHGLQVQQGTEFGFIKFGSRVDVLLPLDAEVKINIGDITKAGRTVLAKLNMD